MGGGRVKSSEIQSENYYLYKRNKSFITHSLVVFVREVPLPGGLVRKEIKSTENRLQFHMGANLG